MVIQSADSEHIASRKSHGRSRMSNGSGLLVGVDGRNTWARRLRDLIGAHLSDLGGIAVASEAERSIIRRVATLTVELERMELGFATAGEAKAADLDLYQRTANSLRRLLEAVGLHRVPRDVTPTLASYLTAKATTVGTAPPEATDASEPLPAPEQPEPPETHQRPSAELGTVWRGADDPPKPKEDTLWLNDPDVEPDTWWSKPGGAADEDRRR